jgi:hypothetical protein
MRNLIDQQINRIIQIDNIEPIRPEFANNSDQITVLRNIMNLKEGFNNTYNLALDEYINALDGYIRNKVKIEIIQRLLTLRRESVPEEFD